MNRITKHGLVAFAAMLATGFVVACSDGSVAPKTGAGNTREMVVEGSTASLAGIDTLRFSFTIDPTQNKLVYLGQGNSIIIPAGALCDPTQSGYGPTLWDTPCPVATQPVYISAKAWLDNGNPHADFSPNVRFAPSADPAGWVMLSFNDSWASLNLLSNIMYCPTPNSACMNEALTDPSLVTSHDPITGNVMRRVKHFSGYNVTAGGDSSSDGGGDLSGGDVRVGKPLSLPSVIHHP